MNTPTTLRLLLLALGLGFSLTVRGATAAPPDDWTALRQEAGTLGKPAWRPMLGYLATLHERATHPATGPLAYEWEELGPGYGYGPAFGHWDVVQEIIDVLPARPAHARRQLLNDLHLQLPNGFLPGLVWMPGSPMAPGHEATFDTGVHGHPPVWVFAADDYLLAHPDRALLQECFERATRQIGWFESARRAPGGGFFYNDVATHKWESGVDEGVRFEDAPAQPSAFVDATSHVYLLCDYAARWARRLGADAQPWQQRADELGEFIRTQLWDEKNGFFYDRWAIEDPRRQVSAYEGLWPVIVGAASPAQAQRVIDGWLLNPKRFFSPHPIATVGVSDPKFSLRMWHGPAWNSMTYWAARGCLRWDRPDAAHALLGAALDDSAAQFTRTGTIWEFYHPFGGHPEDLTRKPQTKRNFPWKDYVGHNPLFAMARMWEQTAPPAAPVAPSFAVASFGRLPDGREAQLYTLTNAHGASVRITNYGGIITSILVPDKNGRLSDVCLGYDSVAEYVTNKSPYFGALIGRYGNRIARGRFTLEGKAYTLTTNDGPNALHGGSVGFDKVMWAGTPSLSAAGDPTLTLTYTSPDGEEGYPGTLQVQAVYAWLPGNVLQLTFTATTDRATPISLTNHCYFNLAGAGHGDVLAHEVMINAKEFLPVDETLIPTGRLEPVAGSPFDFTTAKAIGRDLNLPNEQLRRGQGYDHCYVIANPRGELSVMARVTEPTTGRTLTVSSTEPALQFYTGNFLDGSNLGKGGRRYLHRGAFVMEPEHYPDSPNHPQFPSSILHPGQTYRHLMTFTFGVTPSQ